MSAVEAKRTLVKSPPEVWAKVSDPEVLAEHLADLDRIHITHMEPESVVLWEGDRTSGAVHLEAGGWGTKVTLSAEVEEAAVVEPEPEPVAVAEPETAALKEEVPDVPEPPAAPADEGVTGETHRMGAERSEPPRRGLFARWFGRRKAVALAPPPEPTPSMPSPAEIPEPTLAPPAPEPQPEPEPEPEPIAEAPADAPDPTDHLDAQQALAVLEAALDRLGAAHHRPFSRG